MEDPKIIAVIGFNGSGKTLYVEQMRRRMASDRVRYVSFCDSYGSATDRAYYLQLRWNQHDIDSETPLVGDVLEQAYIMTGEDTPQRRDTQKELYSLFGFSSLLNKYLITLSSGELRKFQLIKTLLASPEVLILDNPFIGLDFETRNQLDELFPKIVSERKLTLYLVIARKENVPSYVDEIRWITSEEQFSIPAKPLDSDKRLLIENLEADMPSEKNEKSEVVRFNNVTIRYGERTILHDLNWTILSGECWALSGQNGSGKSTLLSLICADNPQAYSCDIRLFGKQRGTGESIWDIKRRIGYVSPEMHRSYRHNIPSIQVVASGLKDTVGLYTRMNESEKNICRWWMKIFGIDCFEQRSFLSLSSGEQRLVLLTRAFVKSPDLLILDEPLHGLDSQNRQLAKEIIQAYSQIPNKTIIMVTHYEEELPSCFTLHKRLIKNN